MPKRKGARGRGRGGGKGNVAKTAKVEKVDCTLKFSEKVPVIQENILDNRLQTESDQLNVDEKNVGNIVEDSLKDPDENIDKSQDSATKENETIDDEKEIDTPLCKPVEKDASINNKITSDGNDTEIQQTSSQLQEEKKEDKTNRITTQADATCDDDVESKNFESSEINEDQVIEGSLEKAGIVKELEEVSVASEDKPMEESFEKAKTIEEIEDVCIDDKEIDDDVQYIDEEIEDGEQDLLNVIEFESGGKNVQDNVSSKEVKKKETMNIDESVPDDKEENKEDENQIENIGETTFEEISEGSMDPMEQDEVIEISDNEMIVEGSSSQGQEADKGNVKENNGKRKALIPEDETLADIFQATENEADQKAVVAMDKDNDDISDASLCGDDDLSLEEISEDEFESSKKKKTDQCSQPPTLEGETKDQEIEDGVENVSDVKEESLVNESSEVVDTATKRPNDDEEDATDAKRQKLSENEEIVAENQTVLNVDPCAPSKPNEGEFKASESPPKSVEADQSQTQASCPTHMDASAQTQPFARRGKIVQCSITRVGGGDIGGLKKDPDNTQKWTATSIFEKYKDSLPSSVESIFCKVASNSPSEKGTYSLSMGPITVSDFENCQFRDICMSSAERLNLSFDSKMQGILEAQFSKHEDVSKTIHNLKTLDLGIRYMILSLVYKTLKEDSSDHWQALLIFTYSQDDTNMMAWDAKDGKVRSQLSVFGIPETISKDFVHLLFPEALYISTSVAKEKGRALSLGFSSTKTTKEICSCYELLLFNGNKVEINSMDPDLTHTQDMTEPGFIEENGTVVVQDMDETETCVSKPEEKPENASTCIDLVEDIGKSTAQEEEKKDSFTEMETDQLGSENVQQELDKEKENKTDSHDLDKSESQSIEKDSDPKEKEIENVPERCEINNVNEGSKEKSLEISNKETQDSTVTKADEVSKEVSDKSVEKPSLPQSSAENENSLEELKTLSNQKDHKDAGECVSLPEKENIIGDGLCDNASQIAIQDASEVSNGNSNSIQAMEIGLEDVIKIPEDGNDKPQEIEKISEQLTVSGDANVTLNDGKDRSSTAEKVSDHITTADVDKTVDKPNETAKVSEHQTTTEEVNKTVGGGSDETNEAEKVSDHQTATEDINKTVESGSEEMKNMEKVSEHCEEQSATPESNKSNRELIKEKDVKSSNTEENSETSLLGNEEKVPKGGSEIKSKERKNAGQDTSLEDVSDDEMVVADTKEPEIDTDDDIIILKEEPPKQVVANIDLTEDLEKSLESNKEAEEQPKDTDEIKAEVKEEKMLEDENKLTMTDGELEVVLESIDVEEEEIDYQSVLYYRSGDYRGKYYNKDYKQSIAYHEQYPKQYSKQWQSTDYSYLERPREKLPSLMSIQREAFRQEPLQREIKPLHDFSYDRVYGRPEKEVKRLSEKLSSIHSESSFEDKTSGVLSRRPVPARESTSYRRTNPKRRSKTPSPRRDTNVEPPPEAYQHSTAAYSTNAISNKHHGYSFSNQRQRTSYREQATGPAESQTREHQPSSHYEYKNKRTDSKFEPSSSRREDYKSQKPPRKSRSRSFSPLSPMSVSSTELLLKTSPQKSKANTFRKVSHSPISASSRSLSPVSKSPSPQPRPSKIPRYRTSPPKVYRDRYSMSGRDHEPDRIPPSKRSPSPYKSWERRRSRSPHFRRRAASPREKVHDRKKSGAFRSSDVWRSNTESTPKSAHSSKTNSLFNKSSAYKQPTTTKISSQSTQQDSNKSKTYSSPMGTSYAPMTTSSTNYSVPPPSAGAQPSQNYPTATGYLAHPPQSPMFYPNSSFASPYQYNQGMNAFLSYSGHVHNPMYSYIQNPSAQAQAVGSSTMYAQYSHSQSPMASMPPAQPVPQATSSASPMAAPGGKRGAYPSQNSSSNPKHWSMGDGGSALMFQRILSKSKK